MTRADIQLKVKELKAEADFLERFIEDTGNAGMLTHQHIENHGTMTMTFGK